MTGRDLRPVNTIGAAVVIGGVLTVLVPQHAWTIVQIVAVTAAVATALHVLVVYVGDRASTERWGSPFGRIGVGADGRRVPAELGRIHSALGRERQATAAVPPLPAMVRRSLQVHITAALEREGIDPVDAREREAARRVLAPLTWEVLTRHPAEDISRRQLAGGAPAEVAEVVHAVLDDLDRLSGAAAHQNGAHRAGTGRNREHPGGPLPNGTRPEGARRNQTDQITALRGVR